MIFPLPGWPGRRHPPLEGEEEIEIDAVQREIDGIENELARTRKQMVAYLKELGYGS